MKDFTIGATQFGIEVEESYLELREQSDRSWILSIEVNGSKELFAKLTDSDHSAWGWALYPPKFYLRKLSVTVNGSRSVPITRLSESDIDEHDIALYLMEHNDVGDVAIEVAAGVLSVQGIVDISEEQHPFRISWATSPRLPQKLPWPYGND